MSIFIFVDKPWILPGFLLIRLDLTRFGDLFETNHE
jgi:hypothetical protein